MFQRSSKASARTTRGGGRRAGRRQRSDDGDDGDGGDGGGVGLVIFVRRRVGAAACPPSLSLTLYYAITVDFGTRWMGLR